MDNSLLDFHILSLSIIHSTLFSFFFLSKIRLPEDYGTSFFQKMLDYWLKRQRVFIGKTFDAPLTKYCERKWSGLASLCLKLSARLKKLQCEAGTLKTKLNVAMGAWSQVYRPDFCINKSELYLFTIVNCILIWRWRTHGLWNIFPKEFDMPLLILFYHCEL